MQAGNLRKRITLQQRGTTIDSYGQPTLTWSDLATMYADIQVLFGQQLARSQSIYNMTSHQIVVRYQALFQDVMVVGSYRAKYVSGGVTRYFDIGASMNEDERNRQITLLCSEGLNDGQ